MTRFSWSYPPLPRPSESTAQYRWPGSSYLALNQRPILETSQTPPDSHQRSTDTAAMWHLKYKYWLMAVNDTLNSFSLSLTNHLYPEISPAPCWLVGRTQRWWWCHQPPPDSCSRTEWCWPIGAQDTWTMWLSASRWWALPFLGLPSAEEGETGRGWRRRTHRCTDMGSPAEPQTNKQNHCWGDEDILPAGSIAERLWLWMCLKTMLDPFRTHSGPESPIQFGSIHYHHIYVVYGSLSSWDLAYEQCWLRVYM